MKSKRPITCQSTVTTLSMAMYPRQWKTPWCINFHTMSKFFALFSNLAFQLGLARCGHIIIIQGMIEFEESKLDTKISRYRQSESQFLIVVFQLKHLEEAYTTEHWIVRIYRVKKPVNRSRKMAHKPINRKKTKRSKKKGKKGVFRVQPTTTVQSKKTRKLTRKALMF